MFPVFLDILEGGNLPTEEVQIILFYFFFYLTQKKNFNLFFSVLCIASRNTLGLLTVVALEQT